MDRLFRTPCIKRRAPHKRVGWSSLSSFVSSSSIASPLAGRPFGNVRIQSYGDEMNLRLRFGVACRRQFRYPWSCRLKNPLKVGGGEAFRESLAKLSDQRVE